jgi:hypothetical protein
MFAGSTVNDYKRGKRLKKLNKALSGPLAMNAGTRLKYASFIVVGMLIAVDLAMFVTFLDLDRVQVCDTDPGVQMDLIRAILWVSIFAERGGVGPAVCWGGHPHGHANLSLRHVSASKQ